MDVMPQEYSSCGVGDYRINSIALVSENGSRSCDLRYASHAIRAGKYQIPGMPAVRENGDEMETLEIVLEDNVIHLAVKLLYGVLYDKDVITRSAVITNEGQGRFGLGRQRPRP